MLYSYPDEGEPIRQGDIFHHLPIVNVPLSNLVVVNREGAPRKTSYRREIQRDKDCDLKVLSSVQKTSAIVITQDCDASRRKSITLSALVDYRTIIKDEIVSRKQWMKSILRTMHSNPRLFYLPNDSKALLDSKSVADFSEVTRISREDLENLRMLRAARLNETALEHFRDSLGHFFRRYAFNDWYPLSKEEFEAYRADSKSSANAEPYPWQK